MAKQTDFAVPVRLLKEEIHKAQNKGIDFLHFSIDEDGRLWLISTNSDSESDNSFDSFPPPPGGGG